MMALDHRHPSAYTPHAPPRDPIRPLTPQQERVVDGIRRGLSYAQIGAELGIDRGTVKYHLGAIMHVLPNDAELEPRDCIFLWAWWRTWAVALRERAMRDAEAAALRRVHPSS